MKNIIKKWWFWVIVFMVLIIIGLIIRESTKQIKLKETAKNIRNSASEFIAGINNAQSHSNEFSYNYETGKTEYTPLKITLEMYNSIKQEMTQEEVISILGKYNNKLDSENTYILEWGNSYSPVNDGYWIQIVFNKDKKVLNKYQVGLK